MLDFIAATTRESDRFGRAASQAAEFGDPSTLAVPSCPDWSVDDLVWHLAEVQYFWASIVAGRLDDPGDVVPLVRPDRSGLLDLFTDCSQRLVVALADADPDDACWSWYTPDKRVGWVRRRQAHEALIHRVDAELAVAAAGGGPVGSIDDELAADGADEILRVVLGVDPLPDWASWTDEGPLIRLVAEVDGGNDPVWAVRTGRFAGSHPAGEVYDEVAIRVARAEGDASGPEAAATLRAPAAELDVWLWRRGPLERATIEGDRTLVDRLPELAVVT